MNKFTYKKTSTLSFEAFIWLEGEILIPDFYIPLEYPTSIFLCHTYCIRQEFLQCKRQFAFQNYGSKLSFDKITQDTSTQSTIIPIEEIQILG